ncbi:MAG: fasciclin domain-containing protein [Sporichthyaceae bacterium]|nr:fasciclin domain-containing protein [Sporichthyaceae bacterium]
MAPAVTPTETTMATSTPAGDGVTDTSDTFGTGCANLPTDAGDEGSLEGMLGDPVATAAGNNPMLTQLAEAVQSTDLTDTLDDTTAEYTVFAPNDAAFEALGTDLETVKKDKSKLTDILTYHVVPKRMDAEGILAEGTLVTVQGESLQISGSGDEIMVNDANVLCGNIPTANATVFVIDKVLMPAS